MEEEKMTRVYEGPVKCGTWIRWSGKKNNNQNPQKLQQQQQKILVVHGRWKSSTCSALIEIFSCDLKTSKLSELPMAKCEIDGNPLGFAVHPSGDEFVCATTNGCRLFELHGQDLNLEMVVKDLNHIHDVGPQKCVAFSTDGSRFSVGGEDGHLRILEWPSQNILLDEPRAHKGFRDMDISLDSEFLATTSVDGSARIWKINDGVPLTSLTRSADEKIECCRFSRDGTKPFLYCTVQKGTKGITTVWDISTWNRIGYKRLIKKPASVLSTSLDGKYLALGSNDGDVCIVDVKKMEVCHWSKKLHLGTSISSIEFCPTERVVLSTSGQWGATITRLSVPADWKEWQIYLLLLGLFLASLVIFYILYEISDSFWNFPVPSAKPSSSRAFISDSQVTEESVW